MISKKIKIYIQNPEYVDHCQYCLDFINGHPYNPDDVKWEVTQDEKSADLLYTNQVIITNTEQWKIPAQNLIFVQDHIQSSTLYLNPYQHGETTLYSVEQTESHSIQFMTPKSFNFDWIETIFFHLSRYEEAFFPPEERNDWDMMPETKQILVCNKLHTKPILDELVYALIHLFIPSLNQTVRWAHLSHDIDFVYKRRGISALKWLASVFLKTHSFDKVIKAVRNNWRGEIYDLDFLNKSEDFSSKTIFVLIGGEHKFDPREVKSRDSIVKKVVKEAIDSGYKIGLHPSYRAATDPDLFASELTKLQELIGDPVSLSRQHYLHFDFWKTIDVMEENGIKLDSSLGYNTMCGYRCGTAADFHLFNWNKRAKSPVVERPLTWMDSAQWHESGGISEVFHSEVSNWISNPFKNHMVNIHNSTWTDYRPYGIDMSSIIKAFEVWK